MKQDENINLELSRTKARNAWKGGGVALKGLGEG